MDISILVDNKKSWFMPYAARLVKNLKDIGHNSCLYSEQENVPECDICFMLSCTKIARRDFLEKHGHNIVVHASDLPQGKGFTPIKWQVLAGENDIVLTMFEAVEAVDAGPYYMKKHLILDGYELLDEIHAKLAEKIIDMCLRYINNMNEYPPCEQVGEESFFPKITRNDDELDIHKSILEQFNHLRVADNDNYPLWFQLAGRKYIVKVMAESEL